MLVTLFISLLVFAFFYYCITVLPIPDAIKKIVIVILMVILFVQVFNLFFPGYIVNVGFFK